MVHTSQRDASLCRRILAIGLGTPACRVSQEAGFRLSRYERDGARRISLNTRDFNLLLACTSTWYVCPGIGTRQMLVMNGWRERTEEDLRQLFDAAGLHVTRLIPTLAPQWVIEGTRSEASRRCH